MSDPLAERITQEHLPIWWNAGDGYNEPRESWLTCSCDDTEIIHAWMQFYGETADDPYVSWGLHIAKVTVAATREQVEADILAERAKQLRHWYGYTKSAKIAREGADE